MLTYERAASIAKDNTIPDGKVYCAADAGTFYVFIIAPADFNMNVLNPLIGSMYTAVDKDDGRVWSCHVTDPRLKGARKIHGD